MDLQRLQRNWNNLGRTDPLWAILAERPAADGSWDHEAFFRNGEHSVAMVEAHLQHTGCLPAQNLRALDFGCGYGRLTQALARRFEGVVGVDIAASMIEGARALNAHGERVEYVHNTEPHLRRFADASFDFVITVLVLQHMRPEYALGYVREFLRVLRPGGVAFFQAATMPRNPGAGAPHRVGRPAGEAVHWYLSAHPGQLALQAGQWDWLRVRITNAGGARLPRSGPGSFQIALRWHDQHGHVHGPTVHHPLPADLEPGHRCETLVPVRAPAAAGHWLLLAHLGAQHAWIESVDRVPCRLPVHVVQAPAGAAPAETPPPPPAPIGSDAHPERPDEAIIEVHPVPVAAVLDVVREEGCRIVEVVEDGWAGPDYLSAHYTVTRPA